MNADPGCAWTARVVDDAFLSVVAGTGGVGDGVVTYRAPANEGFTRTSAILVAGEIYLVQQLGVRATTPVCERSGALRQELENALRKSCENITDADLATLRSLSVDFSSSDKPLPGDFTGLRNLDEMFVGQALKDGADIALNPGIFDGLISLRRLEMNLNLGPLAVGVFDGLPNLAYLELNGSDLGTLPTGVFRGLSNLRELRLMRNELTALPPSVFGGLPNLVALDLSDNRLTVLREGVFSGLSNLLRLVLDANDLTTLKADVFSGLSNLRELSLSHNGLDVLELDWSNGLFKLTALYLEGNAIADISSIAEATSLSSVVLRGNSLTDADLSALAGMTNLDLLDLGENSISDIAPLIANAGWGPGNRILLYGNPLNDEALGVHIPSLRARGVEVRAWPVLSISPASGEEGETIAFPVTLLPAQKFDVPLDWRVHKDVHLLGVAAPGSDYPLDEGGVLTFRAGETEGVITVRTTEDDFAELDEGFRVGLYPSPSVFRHPETHPHDQGVGVRGFPIGVILDDDWDDNVQISADGLTEINLADGFGATGSGPPALAASSSDLAVATAVLQNGVLRIVATGPGVATITVTATGADGRLWTRRLTVQVVPSIGGFWRSWRLGLLRPPFAQDGEGP